MKKNINKKIAKSKTKPNILTLPVTGIVVGFLVAVILTLILVRGNINDRYQSQLIEQAAKNVKLRFDQRLQFLDLHAKTIAENPYFHALLIDKNPSILALEESRLKKIIPFARSVRFFNLGEAVIDEKSLPPFQFQSLDMVNRTERGEKVHPEAININGQWLIAVTAALKNPAETKVKGSMFIYYDVSIFADTLVGLPDGHMSLLQSFANTPQIEILQTGQVSALSAVKLALANPNWQISFRPSIYLANKAAPKLLNYLVPSIAALLIALAGVFFGLRKIAPHLHIRTKSQDAASRDNKNHPENFQKSAKDKPAKTKNKVATEKTVASRKLEQAEEVKKVEATEEVEEVKQAEEEVDISSIFRAYDIRGIANHVLTPKVIKRIGLAIGTEAGEIGEQTLLVGADGRLSSPELTRALIEGLTESGRDVINIGLVPTPLLYFATHHTEINSGVVVTASHNPGDYNGLKIVFKKQTLLDDGIQKIYQRYMNQTFSSGDGQVTSDDFKEDYIETIHDDVVVAQTLKVVVDCSNGAASKIAPDLLQKLGCDLIPLYSEVDGNFPNHDPDPSRPENLEDLIITVKSQNADLGLAFDGDGDRLVAVTKEGEIVWPDKLLMLFAKDVVSRNPGSDVVYDVKCTRHLNNVISGFGGRPIVCRTGHSFIKAKMLETNALLGGEMSGHFCFNERWYGFDDGIYAAARLLEIVGSQSETFSDLLKVFPSSVSTPEIYIPISDSEKFSVIQELVDSCNIQGATITTIDGLRIDYSDSWGLVRASNTSANLTLRFEADDQDSLLNIQTLFRDMLSSVDEDLTF